MKIFLSPHNDDETLFGTFTILREHPVVVIVYDSYVQAERGLPIPMMLRRSETMRACFELNVQVEFLGFRDTDGAVTADAISQTLHARFPDVTDLYLPAHEKSGHFQHNIVSAVRLPSKPKRTHYMTYTPAGKSVSKNLVTIETGQWIVKKLRALACYESQMTLDPRCGCYPHFLRDQSEYYA